MWGFNGKKDCTNFGFSSALRVFTKLMKFPIPILKRLNMILILYLDDILFIAWTQDEITLAWDTLIFLLQCLGFLVDIKKSVLQPCQKIEFLDWSLQRQYILEFWNKSVSSEVKIELLWWVSNKKLSNEKSIVTLKIQLIISWVASRKGWVHFCEGCKTGGTWSGLHAKDHINVLWLKATKFGAMVFTKVFPTAKVVYLYISNIAVLSPSEEDGGRGLITRFFRI